MKWFVGLCLVAVWATPIVAETAPVKMGALDLTLQVTGASLPAVPVPQGIFLHRLDRAEELPVRLSALARQTVKLPTGSRWRLGFEIPGLWGSSLLLEIPSDQPVDQPLELIVNLRPAGQLQGEIEAKPRPAAVTLQGEVGNGLVAESFCPLPAAGKFHCPLPAGARDLSLSAEGFARAHFRGLTVFAGQTLDLGKTALVAGASIEGMVVFEDGRPPSGEPAPIVRLFPFEPSPTKRERPRPLAEVPLTEDGTFQLTGLDPGTFVLEITKPGFAPARVFPLEVPRSALIGLRDAIVLHRPLEIDLLLDPPQDGHGRPWQIRLEPAAVGSGTWDKSAAFEGETDETGLLRLRDRVPGRHLLVVTDLDGNRFHGDSDFWLTDGQPIHLTLPIVEISGRLVFRDEGLPGSLRFGGTFGLVRSQFEADPEGHFTGFLPRAGRWLVEVRAGAIQTRRDLVVETRLDRRRSQVVIEIPDTQIFGRVVDSEGHPVPEALVRVDLDGQPIEVLTGDEGRFEVVGIGPGSVHIAVRKRLANRTLVADSIPLDIANGQALGPLEFQLRDVAELSGRLLDPAGAPIPGAIVASHSLGRSFLGDQARSGQDGRFFVTTDRLTKTVALTIQAPGAALTVIEVANDGRPVELVVDQAGGTLEIDLPWSSAETFARGFELILERNGANLPVSAVLDWYRAHGGVIEREQPTELSVPHVSVGDYTACFAPRQQLIARASGQASTQALNCRSGHLSANGRLRLAFEAPATGGP